MQRALQEAEAEAVATAAAHNVVVRDAAASAAAAERVGTHAHLELRLQCAALTEGLAAAQSECAAAHAEVARLNERHAAHRSWRRRVRRAHTQWVSEQRAAAAAAAAAEAEEVEAAEVAAAQAAAEAAAQAEAEAEAMAQAQTEALADETAPSSQQTDDAPCKSGSRAKQEEAGADAPAADVPVAHQTPLRVALLREVQPAITTCSLAPTAAGHSAAYCHAAGFLAPTSGALRCGAVR